MSGQAEAGEPESPLAAGMMEVADAVAFTKLSKSELYSAMGRGELRFFKYGKRRLLAKRDLVTWMDSTMTASRP